MRSRGGSAPRRLTKCTALDSGDAAPAVVSAAQSDPDEAYAAARDRAFRLLAVRSRSVSEIRSRLRRSGCDQPAIDRAVARLLELGYLDDLGFSRQWVAERSSGPKACGRIRLEHELAEKGVARPVIAEALQAYTEEQEEEAAIRLGKALATRGRAGPEAKARRQVYQTLARKGFAREAILRAIGEAFGPAGPLDHEEGR